MDESSNEPEEQQEQQAPINLTLWWSSIAGICAIIIFGSVFVTMSYRNRLQHEFENYRPPLIAKLEIDLDAVNRDGKKVHLGQLRDKVFVAGYQYTDCPSGCLGMATFMKMLLSEFGDDPRFHLVSISVNPKQDTPEKMNAWVKDKGVDAPNWWFLTGDEETIRKYMIKEFMFLGVEENKDAESIASEGAFAHDQRLALVDGGGNIRGYYAVMNPQEGANEFRRLRRDLKMVLNPKLKLSDFKE